MSVLFNRGIFLIFIGILLIIQALVYYHYYLINQLPNDENKTKNKLFGPPILLIVIIVTYTIFFLYYTYLFFTYGESSIVSGSISTQLKNKCPDYTKLKTKVKSKLSHVFENIKHTSI